MKIIKPNMALFIYISNVLFYILCFINILLRVAYLEQPLVFSICSSWKMVITITKIKFTAWVFRNPITINVWLEISIIFHLFL